MMGKNNVDLSTKADIQKNLFYWAIQFSNPHVVFKNPFNLVSTILQV